jgi:hypothetical protein
MYCTFQNLEEGQGYSFMVDSLPSMKAAKVSVSSEHHNEKLEEKSLHVFIIKKSLWS